MAYTKIHGIKTTLSKALSYIEDPKKTEHQMLVSGYNVDPLSAPLEFRMTADMAREVKGDYTRTGGANNLAYHMIQSFSPFDKITAEEAHELGIKWADEILGGKYEYVISTHVDKEQIHNHIIFNATSFLDLKKFNNYKVAWRLRKVSDRLCEEYGLYTMNRSWQPRIRAAIDKAISETRTYEDFIKALTEAGVEVKDVKRLSFRMTSAGQKHFSRGDTIGKDYSREGILARLAEQRPAGLAPAYEQQLVLHPRWKRRNDVKALAATLSTIRAEGIQCDEDFTVRLDELAQKIKDLQGTIEQLETKAQQYQAAAKYILSVQRYAPIKEELAQQPPEKRAWYAARYKEELAAHAFALARLQKLGVDPAVDPDKVLGLVQRQQARVAQLKKELSAVQKRTTALQAAQEQVMDVRGQEAPTQESAKTAKDTPDR